MIMLVFVLALFIGVSSAGQTPSKKPPRTARPATFTCPDTEARQACKSYEELLKANEAGLSDAAYVCFRKNADEFFAISFLRPSFRKRWDADLKQLVLDGERTYPGYGSVWTYREGVQDPSMMPALSFSGTWIPYDETGIFASEKVGFKKQDENDPDVGVYIDASQFNAGYTYENKLGNKVRYSLTIQRSTGRFAESFQVETEKVPFREDAGYCIKRH